MSKHMYSTANLSDKELKAQGNRYFSLRKYEDAANCYTKAIIKNPEVSHYFTNRALCHLKLKRWDQTCLDCRGALDMDSNSVKGHFFLGEALFELENYDEAIKHLQREGQTTTTPITIFPFGIIKPSASFWEDMHAHDLSKEQRLNFGDDITSALREARRKRFSLIEEKRIAQEIELQTYLNNLVNTDKEQQIEIVKLEGGGDEVIEQKVMEIEEKCDAYINELNSLFAKIDERRRVKREVPDFLCGKISFEILQEPVITPSGITYEKKDIEEHLQKVGHFDPVTRVKLTQDQLIPNFSMKEVVDSFIQENEWALDY